MYVLEFTPAFNLALVVRKRKLHLCKIVKLIANNMQKIKKCHIVMEKVLTPQYSALSHKAMQLPSCAAVLQEIVS